MNVVEYSAEPLLRVAQAFAATPRVMAELGRLLRDPNADLDEITVHIKRDGVLAARLLRVANSAAFAHSGKVASIEEAAALVGFNEIHRLVGAVAVDQFSTFTFPLYGIASRRLRENALFGALLMEELATLAGESPQAAYAVGLFRGLGKIALEKLAVESAPVPSFAPGGDTELVQWEKQVFGITGNDATAIILRHWQYPPSVSQAIAEHFYPTPQSSRLTGLLNLAAGIADQLGYGLPGEKKYWSDTEAGYRNAGIDPSGSQPHLDRATKSFERLSRAIG